MSTAAAQRRSRGPARRLRRHLEHRRYPAAANATARARLQAFFAAGGGYIGAGANGANFLTNGASGHRADGGDPGPVTGAAASSTGTTSAAPASPITGASPSQDTAIMDPPTWFTAVPATMSVDGRLPGRPGRRSSASGLWPQDAQSASAPGSAVIAHGTTTAGAARATVFAMNPLYRADPEREWSMVGLSRLLGRPVDTGQRPGSKAGWSYSRRARWGAIARASGPASGVERSPRGRSLD